jgi:putative endonuclease
MYYVYLLRSAAKRNETYVGSTSDLKKRLADHNSGKSTHTNKFKPWELEAYVAFPHEELAHNFEKHLKTGSVARSRPGICAEKESDQDFPLQNLDVVTSYKLATVAEAKDSGNA